MTSEDRRIIVGMIKDETGSLGCNVFLWIVLLIVWFVFLSYKMTDHENGIDKLERRIEKLEKKK